LLVLSNVIVRNNKSTDGGGMYTTAQGGSSMEPVLQGVEFRSNTALRSGGAAYYAGQDGAMNLSVRLDPRFPAKKNIFQGNKCINQGGGIYLTGNLCTPKTFDTLFTENSSKEGGALYMAGGSSTFIGVDFEKNWTMLSGSGIYIAGGTAEFANLTVSENDSVSSGNSGIQNGGTLFLTNATVNKNTVANSGTASITNTVIRNNVSGTALSNAGTLALANVIIENNQGGGISNTASGGGEARAVLTNVTIAGNAGGAVSNNYMGVPDNGTTTGLISVLMNNVRITGNSDSRPGAAIYNEYSRYSGYGIQLTLNNVTIAGNDSGNNPVIFCLKNTGVNGKPAESDESGEPLTNRSFPVYMRLRNSVVYGNSGSVSGIADIIGWGTGGSAPGTAFTPTGDRQAFEHSLIEGVDLSGQGGSLNGVTANPGFAGPLAPGRDAGGDYRPGPGSALVDQGDAALYLSPGSSNLILQLFWKTYSIHTFTMPDLKVITVGSDDPDEKGLVDFLPYDNSFNIGDLRDNGGAEGPYNERKKGTIDIGAYEQQ
jgi:predicted outer membrane repeat protein